MPTHRQLHPEQYTHKLVGTKVWVIIKGDTKASGKVERVIAAPSGLVATIQGDKDPTRAWAVKYCFLQR